MPMRQERIAMGRLRNRLVDGPNSIGEQRRVRRWEWLRSEFPRFESMSVLDLGGTAEAWLRAPVRPASVHVVNLEPEPGLPAADWIRTDQADACDLPAHIASCSYDLVFSNAVLEHVGGHAQRIRFADTVHKMAPLHWVQTPYRYFPIEPHWLFPGFQFLPLATRARVSQHWPLVYSKSKSWEEGLRAAMGVELISRSEMSIYFPTSAIASERVLGVVKALIAIKSS
jgi:hypothetical protein